MSADDVTVPGSDMGTTTNDAVIEVSGLWKGFGRGADQAVDKLLTGNLDHQENEAVVAVRDVSFSVKRGENFIVMGLSGSGKSTLLRCLVRLLEPTRGKVVIDGQSILELDPAGLRELRRQRLAMVFQHFGLLAHRSVRGNAEYGLEVQGVGRDQRRVAVDQALAQVGLSEWAEHYPDQLSGGMRQRVGLARALAVQPEIVFFDEPFSALDPLIRHEMQEQLLQLQATQRRTIVFITHDFDEAIRLGDRIAIMKDGVFDQVGTVEELVMQPATSYVAEFTRDVDKTKVLKVGSLLGPRSVCGPNPVSVTATLDSVMARLVAAAEPVSVVDEAGSYIGDVDRGAVHAVLVGHSPIGAV